MKQDIIILNAVAALLSWRSFPGIPPHIDTHSAFEETILSLSLGAQVSSTVLIIHSFGQNI